MFVKITTPSAEPTFITSESSIMLQGTSNHVIWSLAQDIGETLMTPLFTFVDQDDALTEAIAAALDSTRWSVRASDGNIYVGSGGPMEFLAYDELRIPLTLQGADPDPQSENLVSYDGDPAEQWSPGGVSLLSFTDAEDAQFSPTLAYSGSITNDAGTSVFTVTGPGPQWNSTFAIPLQAGDNVITITATDEEMNTASDTITINRQLEHTPLVTFSHGQTGHDGGFATH